MIRKALIISLFLALVVSASEVANSSAMMQRIETNAVILKGLLIEYNNTNDDNYREYLEMLIKKQRNVIKHIKAGA